MSLFHFQLKYQTHILFLFGIAMIKQYTKICMIKNVKLNVNKTHEQYQIYLKKTSPKIKAVFL